MTVCCQVTKEFKNEPQQQPIDNTARPQIVYPQQNPWLYELLTYLNDNHNIPILINTLFNSHEEPITSASTKQFELSGRTCLVLDDVH